MFKHRTYNRKEVTCTHTHEASEQEECQKVQRSNETQVGCDVLEKSNSFHRSVQMLMWQNVSTVVGRYLGTKSNLLRSKIHIIDTIMFKIWINVAWQEQRFDFVTCYLQDVVPSFLSLLSSVLITNNMWLFQYPLVCPPF